MLSKKIMLTNFSHTILSQSSCLRPDNENELTRYIAENPKHNLLIRGCGLSYNDSCFNTNGIIVNGERLNHLLHFDDKTGIVICQAGVPINDLFLLNSDFIPPVIPGTVHATVGGGIAHDVHGKNNHQEGSFGHHLMWFDLLINGTIIRCSREENNELFFATIAGLGLTGIITRAAIRLKKASRYVQVHHKPFSSIRDLTEYMLVEGIHHDYQVAWLDLVNATPRAIHSVADHCESFAHKEYVSHEIPSVPFSLIKHWNIKLFNKFYFNSKKVQQKLPLQQFNNPLDKLLNWNRLYGPKGLIQFQAVFGIDNASSTIEHLVQLIHTHKATPTLSVLKLFTQSGEGLLSFCTQGFTLAIDFIHNTQARQAISAMNELITKLNGRIYLAKDLLLNEVQYKKMYQHHKEFSELIGKYSSTMRSDLAQRLGIINGTTTMGDSRGHLHNC